MKEWRDHAIERGLVVHVLRHGEPLCGFMASPYKTPSEWPEGHRWVTLIDRDEATCASCAKRAAEIVTADTPRRRR